MPTARATARSWWSGSALTSGTWTTARSTTTRAVSDSRVGRIGNALRIAAGASTVLSWTATRWIHSPSNRKAAPMEAPQSSTLLRTIVSKTVWTLVCEALIVLKTPLVAVCRCSESASARPRRRAAWP